MRSSPPTPHLFSRVPLAGNYPAAVVLALLALSPYLVLTTATSLMQSLLMRDLSATPFELQLTSGLSNAAYAFGAVAAADIVQRIPRRLLYLICEAGFVVSTVLALSAPGIALFTTGVILQGLATGMLLVAALPPLITGHGVERLPTTAAVISLGLFGVVTFGPLVGGLVGSVGGWRYLFAAIGVLAAIGLTVGALTFESNEPPAKNAEFDWLAIPLALGATVLPFFGVSWLTRGSFTHPAFLTPVIVGLLFGVFLVVGQYRKANPLMPVRPISNTLPVAGTLGAMIVGATFITLLELTEAYLLRVPHYGPLRVGALVTTQLAGVVIASVLFRRLVTTRWTPYLALSGLLGVAVGAAVLLSVSASNASALVPVAALFLGYGAGAGVAPGLFLAGFSVPVLKIGPTFALVELLRSEAAFLIGPVLLHLALTTGITHGFHLAVLITMSMALAGVLLIVVVYVLGGARPRPPELEAWITGESTAYHSPPLAAAIRKV
ncbi:MFS transporter [Streptomyces sp. NPDC051569]|uniref:MFS transporter n=1 Tax=Streptomyces sp. NPDC051569 TaxID=3365661 RepID=UPI00379B585B